jgi:hypothetical protein
MDRSGNCRFCGGDKGEAGHWRHCDGKQGALEALPLFSETLPYTGLTDATLAASRAAADRMASELSAEGISRAETARGRVYRYITAGSSGATDNETGLALRMSLSTVRPRRIELWRAGLIESAGYKRGGCTVWKAVPRDAVLSTAGL